MSYARIKKEPFVTVLETFLEGGMDEARALCLVCGYDIDLDNPERATRNFWPKKKASLGASKLAFLAHCLAREDNPWDSEFRHWAESLYIWSLDKGHGDIARKLLEGGVNPSLRRFADLVNGGMLAAASGDLELLRTFIKRDGPVDEVSKSGANILMYAIRAGQLNTFHEALSFSEVNAVDNAGNTALHSVCHGLNFENLEEAVALEMIDRLLNHGAEVDQRNQGYATALHIAGEGTSVAVVKRLLDANADPEARNWKNMTPRELAYGKRNMEVWKALSPELVEHRENGTHHIKKLAS